jgi:hypothetical protein
LQPGGPDDLPLRGRARCRDGSLDPPSVLGRALDAIDHEHIQIEITDDPCLINDTATDE